MTTTSFEEIHRIMLELIIFLKLKLPEQDIHNIRLLLDNDEYGEAFDVLCTQTYEYDIKVNKQFYDNIKKIAGMMKLGKESWSYIEEQVI